MLASQNDTIQLVKRAQAGDVEAFAILVQNHQRDIYGFLVGLLGDREDAYDFAQQVFIKAWLNLAKLKSASFNHFFLLLSLTLKKDWIFSFSYYSLLYSAIFILSRRR